MKFLNQLSEYSLVLNYQKTGDPIYFGELYNRYFAKIYHYSLGLVKTRDAAFDITQDLFIKISEKLFKLKEPVTFPAWIFRIAYNDSINHLKYIRKHRINNLSIQYDVAETLYDQDSVLAKDLRISKLICAIEEIPQEISELVITKYVEGKSIEDLASRHGLSESAVKMRLSRAKIKLKKMVANA